MADLDLAKQLKQQEPARPKLSSASNLILIDNYDSFTYNVYQYLELEGAHVTVYRNDQITLEELIAKKPTQLVVSPGPGHPNTDSGISTAAIQHFGGKIPVFGVCMGQQCIISAYGGIVDVTGEILHGKTSPLSHDGKGIYEGVTKVPVKLPVTRYHSLAGTLSSLPSCLELSSWIESGPDGAKGIIMGVRHKEYVLEGVQFHPESILSADGRKMLRNFLKMRGGTWAENSEAQQANHSSQDPPAVNGNSHKDSMWKGQSILDTIFRKRSEQVAQQKLVPSQRLEDLEECYKLDIAPPLIDFSTRVRQTPYTLSLLAEVKRASPSKGEIAMHINAPAQAKRYALAGASVISVLTEPTWFKGSLEDLRAVRQVLNGMPNRPAVLRKEFVFDEYQILEARLAGADTVLLIVKMLDDGLLSKLYEYSKSLGIEPLVEVNTAEEMQRALKLKAKVIGVNNRNLTNFEVDLETTSRLMDDVPDDTFICALSGISGPKDVDSYRSHRVGGVLVGEALMRASDVTTFIADLLGMPNGPALKNGHEELLVKVCGTRTPEAAKVAIEAGADLIGMIMVEGRSRFVPTEKALEISAVVHNTKKPSKKLHSGPSADETENDYFAHGARTLSNSDRALLVGVFQNHTLQHIQNCVRTLGLDLVQLHGSEPIEWASLLPVPVLKRFGPSDSGLGTRGYHTLPLIDSAAGGTGKLTNSTDLKTRLESDSALRVMLAGGLNPDNVAQILASYKSTRSGIAAVDVSSGVETDGKQDLSKIKRFVTEAKSA